VVKKIVVRPISAQVALGRSRAIVKKYNLGEDLGFSTKFTRRAGEFLKNGKPEMAIRQYLTGRSANGFVAYDAALEQFRKGKPIPSKLFSDVVKKIQSTSKLESMADEIIRYKQSGKIPEQHASDYLSSIATRSLGLGPDYFPAMTSWHEQYGHTPQSVHFRDMYDLVGAHVPKPLSEALKTRRDALIAEARKARNSAKA